MPNIDDRLHAALTDLERSIDAPIDLRIAASEMLCHADGMLPGECIETNPLLGMGADEIEALRLAGGA